MSSATKQSVKAKNPKNQKLLDYYGQIIEMYNETGGSTKMWNDAYNKLRIHKDTVKLNNVNDVFSVKTKNPAVAFLKGDSEPKNIQKVREEFTEIMRQKKKKAAKKGTKSQKSSSSSASASDASTSASDGGSGSESSDEKAMTGSDLAAELTNFSKIFKVASLIESDEAKKKLYGKMSDAMDNAVEQVSEKLDDKTISSFKDLKKLEIGVVTTGILKAILGEGELPDEVEEPFELGNKTIEKWTKQGISIKDGMKQLETPKKMKSKQDVVDYLNLIADSYKILAEKEKDKTKKEAYSTRAASYSKAASGVEAYNYPKKGSPDFKSVKGVGPKTNDVIWAYLKGKEPSGALKEVLDAADKLRGKSTKKPKKSKDDLVEYLKRISDSAKLLSDMIEDDDDKNGLLAMSSKYAKLVKKLESSDDIDMDIFDDKTAKSIESYLKDGTVHPNIQAMFDDLEQKLEVSKPKKKKEVTEEQRKSTRSIREKVFDENVVVADMLLQAADLLSKLDRDEDAKDARDSAEVVRSLSHSITELIPKNFSKLVKDMIANVDMVEDLTKEVEELQLSEDKFVLKSELKDAGLDSDDINTLVEEYDTLRDLWLSDDLTPEYRARIKYNRQLSEPFDVKYANEVVNFLETKLSTVQNKEITGAYRRGEKELYEIDLVLDEVALDESMEKLEPYIIGHYSDNELVFQLTPWNDKVLKLVVYPVSEEGFYHKVLYTTGGSNDFMSKLTMAMVQKGYSQNEDGLIVDSDGNVIPADSEEALFEALGMKYVEPKRR